MKETNAFAASCSTSSEYYLEVEVWLGHTSPFGQRWMEALCHEPRLRVSRIIIPSIEQIVLFKKKLSRGAFNISEREVRRDYKKALQWLQNKARELGASIYPVDDVQEAYRDASGHAGITVFCAAYPQLFKQVLLEKLGRVINFHPSYLPRCRGAHPIYWAIASNEPFSGLSSHLITTRLDTGPIVSRVRVDYDAETIDYDHLLGLITQAMPVCIADTIDRIVTKQPAVPQEDTGIEPTYFTNDLPIHRKINWAESFVVTSARIRAGNAYCFSPAGHWVYWDEPVFRQDCPQITNTHRLSLLPGTIVHLEPNYAWIRLERGFLYARYKMVYGNRRSRALMKVMRLLGFDLFDLKVGHQLH